MISFLVVDDEPLIRMSLTKKIEECSATAAVVGTAADGLEALAWLEGHYADVCVTDVRMPNMDGLKLIGRMKELYPWMTSIVVSSYEDFGYVQQSLRLGVIDYVLKPVDTDDLKLVLDKTISELRQSRDLRASRLMVNHLPQSKGMIDRWSEQMRSLQTEQNPLLVVDTLEMLEEAAGNHYYLLPHLAVQWLRAMNESLAQGSVTSIQGEDAAIELADLVREDARRYYRLSAVHRLETGARALAEFMLAQRNKQGTRMISLVKSYIHDRYADRITLQEVADAVSMSRTYLASLFKQETGMTILHYIVTVRMEEAKRLLVTSPLKVYEVAARVGYEDSIHFSKLFKEQYGLNPLEYKKRLGG
ncbi:response regulator [Paenibacillus sp.]|uniref:response regulator transcription factor n=1 Tax=Paenibacillus sp. TaxID=58172 RepID=UPI00281285FB|nr:response regulator [Paenibacillus sp.]